MANNDSEKTFHIGLTMGGAVSAGAYTGGVMDYLFEILDKWDKAKKRDLPGIDYDLVPEHNVVIDVMGGTSAGGMATVMSALYAINNNIKPVTDKEVDNVGKKHGNIFYDSWVNLAETTNSTTTDQLLELDDLDDGKLKSLLNSKFLDIIAKNAFQIEGEPTKDPIANLPSYISKDLEMLISHTMLRGIPLEVAFRNAGQSKPTPGSNHASYEHFLFSHFKLNMSQDEKDKELYLWLNPYNEKAKAHLKKAAVATGAFPIGLKFREFDKESFSQEYLKTIICRLADGNMGDPDPSLKGKVNWEEGLLKSIITDYKSIAIDGGAINNEPYDQVLSILRQGKSETRTVNNQFCNFGIILIDPFPDSPELVDKGYTQPEELFDVAKNILATLWDQSKVKRKEFSGQFNNSHIFRGSIFPRKYENDKPISKPLASGSLKAFGGLLNINFRHHDFYLGRNNARNFVRAFFSMPYFGLGNEKNHPIHQSWSPEMVKQFLVTLNGKDYLPVIPDMNLLLDGTHPTREEARKYSVPEMPKMAEQDIERLRPKIKLRTSKIIDILTAKLPKSSDARFWQFGKKIKGLLKKMCINNIKKELNEMAVDAAIDFVRKEMGYSNNRED